MYAVYSRCFCFVPLGEPSSTWDSPLSNLFFRRHPVADHKFCRTMLTKFRLNVYPAYYLLEGILLMEEIPNNHLGCENHVINCQPQLVSQISSINCITVGRFDKSFLHSRSLTWPLKSYRNPKETACLPTIHFQGRTVKHWGRWVVSTTWHQIIGTCPVHPVHPVHPLQFSPVASTGFKATTPPFPHSESTWRIIPVSFSA